MAYEISHAVELWKAGLCACGICGKDVPEPVIRGGGRGNGGTMDHVFPVHPKPGDLERLRRLWAVVADPKFRRKVIAHRKCNSRKSNRPPTGCEIIFLMAVNARLQGRNPVAGGSERTRIRRERRYRARDAQRQRLAAMQAEVDGL